VISLRRPVRLALIASLSVSLIASAGGAKTKTKTTKIKFTNKATGFAFLADSSFALLLDQDETSSLVDGTAGLDVSVIVSKKSAEFVTNFSSRATNPIQRSLKDGVEVIASSADQLTFLRLRTFGKYTMVFKGQVAPQLRAKYVATFRSIVNSATAPCKSPLPKCLELMEDIERAGEFAASVALIPSTQPPQFIPATVANPIRFPKGVVATDAVPDALSIELTVFESGVPIFSNGGIVIQATSATVTGTLSSVDEIKDERGRLESKEPARKESRRPLKPVDLSPFRPGGPLAIAVGKDYQSIKKSQCVNGSYNPPRGSLSGLVYVECAVEYRADGGIFPLTLVAEGPISLIGTSARLTPYVEGLALLSGDTSDKSIDVKVTSAEILGSIVAAGPLFVRATDLKVLCGLRGAKVQLSGNTIIVMDGPGCDPAG
jgi:hypothetical protein